MKIEIDSGSGFCPGVVNAIKHAEEELEKGGTLYCLGDIVHNESEVKRLENLGLKTIDHAELSELKGAKVLLRAHGEPPSTYETARKNHITLIDATCPVVLGLQRRIKKEYEEGLEKGDGRSIVIYGKKGHAEVNGLVGQTEGHAIVVENVEDAKALELKGDVSLFSQTTKSLEEYKAIRNVVTEKLGEGGKCDFHDTICRQVANRIPNIRRFAAQHDVVLFVSGKKSSNGKILYEEARSVNPRTYLVSSREEAQAVFTNEERDADKETLKVGICGATSTPKWLMEELLKEKDV